MTKRRHVGLALGLMTSLMAMAGCVSVSVETPVPLPMEAETLAPHDPSKMPVNNKPKKCIGYVALTFDDGPSELTPSLLQVLRYYEIPATFFNVGNQERDYPDEAKAIAADGHEMGNHTMTHADLMKLSMPKAIKEIVDANKVHNKLDLPTQRLFRPPYGSTSTRLRHEVETNKKLEMMEVLWTIDSKDYQTLSAIKIYEQSKGMIDGGIILMHDGKIRTIEALPSIITYYQDKGLCWGVIGRGPTDVKTVAGLPHAAMAMAPPKQ